MLGLLATSAVASSGPTDMVQRLRSFAGLLIPKERILRNAEQREFLPSGLRLATVKDT
jgi:hypothetical protein